MIRLLLRFSLFLIIVMTLGCRATADIPIPAASAVVPSPPVPTLATPTLASTEQPTATMTARATAAAPAETATLPPPTPAITPSDVPADTTPPPTPCAEPGRIETGSFDSVVAGESMRYRIYLPPCYGLDGHVYPALYMFGGNIHDDAIWDTLGLDEAAEAGIAAGDIPPLLIVMPDNGWLANTTTSGPNSYEGFVIDELMPHIEANYCAWSAADGRAVGGISRGGYWSLMMAFRRPDLFGSVGAHSPALIDSHAGAAEDPVITGATNDLGNLRIWVDIGERDPYLVEAQPLHEALTSVDVSHVWQVNDGTHEEAYWRDNLENYLRWYSDGWRIDRAEMPDCPDR